ncbi:MAG: CAP domain-containing protein [Methanoregula sp.]
MSDTSPVRRYRRQTTIVSETFRKRRFSGIALILLIAGTAGMVGLIAGSGIATDNNSRISDQLIARINLERLANNLEPVTVDAGLADRALAASTAALISSPVSSSGTDLPATSPSTNLFVIPADSWPVAGPEARQQIFDTLENNVNAFRNNILSGQYTKAGIGVTSDGNNQYIAVTWG